jgi:hypothetical protein
MSFPWVRWVLGTALIGLLGVSGCCGMGMWKMGSAMEEAQKAMEKERARMEEERKTRTVVVTAADLLKDFQDDPAAADRKYLGKYLELSGTVERSDKGRDGLCFAILHGGDAKAAVKIECFFEFNEEHQVLGLEKGHRAIVRGEYSGRVSHVQLRGCVLAK